MNKSKLIVILESKNWQEIKEHQNLVHDAGLLLRWIIERLNIPRDRWVHTYCYEGNKKSIPNKKAERRAFLEPHIEALEDFIEANSPCSLVGMGKLAAEVLVGGSVLKRLVGARWNTKMRFTRLGVETVGITYMPDAALHSPDLCVPISRMIVWMVREIGIEPVINYQLRIPKNWHLYW